MFIKDSLSHKKSLTNLSVARRVRSNKLLLLLFYPRCIMGRVAFGCPKLKDLAG